MGKNKKIAIIGRGNAGCLSALHFSQYNKLNSNTYEVEMYFDPNIPAVPTGQGSTLEFPDLLFKCFSTNWYKKFPVTLKTGIMYENWGIKNKQFFHEFPFGRYSIHCTPKSFQDYVCSNLSLNFKEIKEHVINYDEIDADYIIDCRGTPKNLDGYLNLINPLNSALLAELPYKENDVNWTRCIATPNGWTFYIPLPDTTSVGYIYNKQITSKEEAETDFINRFNISKINHAIEFNQYVAKHPILDKRIFLNGNKLFFLEPLEATAMGTYINVNRFYHDVINNVMNAEEAEKKVHQEITKVQNFILFHYLKGSKFSSKFWNYAKNISSANMPKDVQQICLDTIFLEKKYIRESSFTYAQWGLFSFENLIDGIDITQEDLIQ